MSASEKMWGFFWLAMNVVCALWNFSTYANTGSGFNFAIGALNVIVSAMLVKTLVRFW